MKLAQATLKTMENMSILRLMKDYIIKISRISFLSGQQMVVMAENSDLLI